MINMTANECRAEALKRVQESDRLFAQYKELPESERGEFHPLYNDVCHLRQTAAVYAALAGGVDG